MQHRIVSEEEWLKARKEHLAKEKELTRQLDRLRAERRELPWTKVVKPYVFHGRSGPQALSDLFDGRSQLIVQHFMFGPGWQEGCVGCSFGADHVDAALVHLENHDVSFVAVSRAPLAEIEAFRQRMGWRFRWVSSNGSDFNYDYHVSFHKDEIANGKIYYNYVLAEIDSDELPGLSVFYRDGGGEVFHTYSTYARGGELLAGAYNFLDLTPKGRDENGPAFNLTDWVRHHDRYGETTGAQRCADPAPATLQRS
ncbi:MAG TPA: thioredoxin family protein [Steroidobacteraceae bacterium]|nr:thioredoxin family protein [Steroidobacteraceae bacterium]